MSELTSEVFDDLCRTGPVQTELQASEARRAALQRRGRIEGAAAIAFAVLSSALTWRLAPTFTPIVAVIGLVFTVWAWSRARERAAAAMKASILPRMAERAGLTYTAWPRNPEGFATVRRTLFSGAPLFGFSDRFRGLVDGRDMAFYEAVIQRRAGRNSRQTLFEGRIFWIPRRTAGRGRIVVRPDRRVLNFLRLEKGMERVKFDTDPQFEKRFEVYATDPAEASVKLGSSELRAWLLAGS